MDINGIISRIDGYLRSNKSFPVIVDVQNRSDLQELTNHYATTTNQLIHVGHFCKQDNVFKIDELMEELSKNTADSFVLGLSSFLKLEGEKSVRDTLKSLISLSVSGHVIVFTYQCRNYLKFSDPRIEESGKILVLDGEPDFIPPIVFISPSLRNAFKGCYVGFNMFSRAVEGFEGDVIYLATAVNKDRFPFSLYFISQLNNGYDIICSRDSRARTIPQSFGTDEQWNHLLSLMGENDSLSTVADRLFGYVNNLAAAITDYVSFEDNEQWIYFIFLCIFGVKNNRYLNYVVSHIANHGELIQAVFRFIIHFDRNDAEFSSMYKERKAIISHFTDDIESFTDFCKVVSQKEKDYIYYLTDLTQVEREKIICYFDTYGYSYTREEIIAILNTVYPDLALYLSPYKFRNELLDSYFNAYKYQKVINKILPTFEAVVDEQAEKHEFYSVLKPRSSVVDKMNVSKAQAYFVDALGVEYLGFIISKCNALGLSASVTVCRAELPTLTEFNKDFVSAFEFNGCHVADVKELDTIKHHGTDNFDYEKVKTPIYLISELAILDELIKKIKASLVGGKVEKVIIASDHGASRLSVLHETETIWSMETIGEHSGRCCPKNVINEKPSAACEAEGYWVLANYDRFKGGRKANVEVHGGASLEEIAVPIIEITIKKSDVEAFITEDSKIITLGPKDLLAIKIYVSTKSEHIGIELNGNYYEAVATENENCYKVVLPNITRKGIYSFDILLGTDVVAKGQKFEIKKKGMSENNLF